VKNAVGMVGGSNTKVCLSGALNIDMQANMNFINMSRGTTATDAINAIYDTLNETYSETARKFFS
jgi:hypothetical protein